MSDVENARIFATKKHEGYFRRDGTTPYIAHPGKVASLLEKDDEKILAWLHDVIEETPTPHTEIINKFGLNVSLDLNLLTHDKKEDYFAYLKRLKKHERVRNVKIADIVANLTDKPTTKQIHKYVKALQFLAEVEK